MEAEDIAVAITIEMKDGSRFISTDADCANEVWQWWQGCELMAWKHGGRYKGKTLKRLGPGESE